MATIAEKAVQVSQMMTGGPPVINTYPEAASQTFVAGQPVALVAGYITEITSGPIGDAGLLGFATEAAGNTATSGERSVGVYDLTTETVCEFNLREGNSTTPTNHVMVAADIGVAVGMQWDAADNRVYLTTAVTGADACFWVQGPAGPSVVGDTNARVLARPMSLKLQSNPGLAAA